jgi:CRP/FNR family transcriptional regulator
MRGQCAACEIRELSVCSALSEGELQRLRAIISSCQADTGATVIAEGDPATDLFNVVRGTVKLYKLLPDGRRLVTGFLFPGDFLGIALNDTYAYSAEAIEPLQLCRFPRKKLEALLAELPRLERRLLGETAHELAAAQDQMLLLGRKTAKERVASFLVGLSRRATKRRRPASPLEIPMSRTDMADYLGLTTETVSRTLTQLRQAKLIAAKGRNGIEILNMRALGALVDGDSPDY